MAKDDHRLALNFLISRVIIMALFRRLLGVVSGLVFGAMNPLDHQVFQPVNRTRGGRSGLLCGDQIANHVHGGMSVLHLRDGCQFGKLPVRARCRITECANALCDQVNCGPLLCALHQEHLVKAIELWPGHIPIPSARP
jgi:hypothetical protein